MSGLRPYGVSRKTQGRYLLQTPQLSNHLVASAALTRSASASVSVLGWSIAREGGGIGEAEKDSFGIRRSALLGSTCLRALGTPVALTARASPSIGVVGSASPDAL